MRRSIRRAVCALHVAFISACSLAVSHASAQGTSGCLAADTLHVPAQIAFLKLFINSSLPIYQTLRDSVGLASQPTPNAHLVTSQHGCVLAVNALNTLLNTHGQIRHVWLYEMGSSGYGVEDPTIAVNPGEDKPRYMFNHQYVFKKAIR